MKRRRPRSNAHVTDPHYEIDRAQQYEIKARVIRARHAHDLPGSSRHSVKFRIGRAVAAVGVCAASAPPSR